MYISLLQNKMPQLSRLYVHAITKKCRKEIQTDPERLLSTARRSQQHLERMSHHVYEIYCSLLTFLLQSLAIVKQRPIINGTFLINIDTLPHTHYTVHRLNSSLTFASQAFLCRSKSHLI